MNYNFDDYLNTVKQNIKNKKLHAPICAELESHLQDSADFYVEIGYDEETANQKALEDMGEPATVGENMAKLHKLSVGQVIVEILFVTFAVMKLIDILWVSTVLMFCNWVYCGDTLTMLCLTFIGFALALHHKRLLPAVMSLLCVFADVLSIQSFFYVVIIQLSGGWKEYLDAIQYGWNGINSVDEQIFVISVIPTIVTVGLITFTFVKIKQYIKTPVKMSLLFTKSFYTASIAVLCLALTLTAATKYYLYQTDIKEKADFDKVVSDLCDYCLENEKITAEDIDQLMAHFDYLDFVKEDCDGYDCGGHGCGHYVAETGDKSITCPKLVIGIADNGDIYINADYNSVYNYYSFNPFLFMKILEANDIWSDKKHVENGWPYWIGNEILDEGDLDIKSADASRFTDLVKEYDLVFGYHYYVDENVVEFGTKIETGGIFGFNNYVVQVKNGIITEVDTTYPLNS